MTGLIHALQAASLAASVRPEPVEGRA